MSSESSDEEEIISESSSDEDEELSWGETLQRIKRNDPRVKTIDNFQFNEEDLQNMTGEGWEELGRDIANNTRLKKVDLSQGALNDHRVSFLSRGLTRSSSIETLALDVNGFSVAGVRSMVPFLQNANSLTRLDLDDNNLQTEGFHLLISALSDSPVEYLFVKRCGIESVDIKKEHIPRQLKYLYLESNIVNADGCRGLATLLQGEDSTLGLLNLINNKIDDDGVEILVDALQNNTSLAKLYLQGNNGISTRGMIMLLKLVNDISSIEATLQSNHTLRNLNVVGRIIVDQTQTLINTATNINIDHRSNPEAAGREKVIQTQLHSKTRAELAEMQGVNHSLYSEIDPLNLPEVLALVGRHHGQGELYVALKSAIAELISTVNRKECIRQKRDYYLAKAKQLDAELAAIEAAEGCLVPFGSESREIKKRRAC